MQIAVVDLGYVGLPLSLEFARSRVSMLRIDIDPKGRALLRKIEKNDPTSKKTE
jgi:UDP-N-acetyl-D-mannosaminuronate dehydrogenase